MAETVRIEIPVSVKDNTSAGVQSATRNMSNFERSMKRTEQQLNRLDRAHHVSWLSAGLIGVGASKLISGGKNVASALTPIGSAIKNIASAASEADTVGGFFTL